MANIHPPEPPPHPENGDGEEWKGEQEQDPTDKVMQKFDAFYDRMVEVQTPAMDSMTDGVQRMRGILHEELSISAKLEVASTWAATFRMFSDILREQIKERLPEMYKKEGGAPMPFCLDRNIPDELRGEAMTQVSIEIAKKLKEEKGLDIFADQDRILRA